MFYGGFLYILAMTSLFAAGLTARTGCNGQCSKDACFQAASQSNCKSFLGTVTTTSKASTIYRTVTVSPFTSTTFSSTVYTSGTATLTSTQYLTASTTTTTTMTSTALSATATATTAITTTTTVTLPSPSPTLFKRDVQADHAAQRRGSRHYPAQCTYSQRFSSACSCVGIHPQTTTLQSKRTVTSTITKAASTGTTTITKAATTSTSFTTTKTVTRTVTNTNIATITTAATYSTTGTSTFTSTAATATATVDYTQPIILQINGTNFPLNFVNGWAQLTNYGYPNIPYVYGITFNSSPIAAQPFSLDYGNGHLSPISGPSNANGQLVSYVYSSTGTFAKGGSPVFVAGIRANPVICKATTPILPSPFQCEWGTSGQVANLYTCSLQLYFADPKSTFTCAKDSTGSTPASVSVNMFAFPHTIGAPIPTGSPFPSGVPLPTIVPLPVGVLPSTSA